MERELLDLDDCETLEVLIVEAIAKAIVLPDEAGPSNLMHYNQIQRKLVALRQTLPEAPPIPNPF